MTVSMYCESVPTLQKAWDNTSLKTLKQCPYLYWNTIGKGYKFKREHPRLSYGTYFHWGMEKYEKLKALGEDQESAMRSALKATLALMRERKFDERDTTYTRLNMARAMVWYIDHYGDDPAKTLILKDGQPAVELSFRVPLPINSPDGDPYLYCGHIDRMIRYGSEIFNNDYKTTKSALDEKYFSQFSPDGQMSGYIYGTKIGYGEAIAGAMIDAVQLGVTFNRYHRSFIYRNDDQIEEWLENTCYWIKQAEIYATSGKWILNEESCSNYGGCTMRSICSKPRSTRQLFFNDKFEHNPWNPLDNR